MTASGTAAGGGPANGKIRVLLADDHAIVREGVKRIKQAVATYNP